MQSVHRFILISLVALSSLFLQSCSISNEPFKMAGHVWPGYEFMFLARELNMLDPAKVTMVETDSASESLQKLKDGLVDGAALTLDELIRARSEGVDLAAVMVFDISAGADVLLGKPEFSVLEDLKGKRLGVETGAVGAIMLNQALEKCGCSQADITVVDLNIDEHLDAWKMGQLDAVITYEPVYSQLKALGAKEFFSSSEIPNLIVDVLAVKRSSLSNKDALQHLVDAHFSALRHFNVQQQDAFYRLATRLGVKADEVPGTYQGLILPDQDSNIKLFRGDSSLLFQSATKLVSIMLGADMIETDVMVDDIFIADFVNQAVK